MKRMNKTWAIVASMGLLLAICTADGSKAEIGLRACGLACFFIGAFMAGWTDKKGAKQ